MVPASGSSTIWACWSAAATPAIVSHWKSNVPGSPNRSRSRWSWGRARIDRVPPTWASAMRWFRGCCLSAHPPEGLILACPQGQPADGLPPARPAPGTLVLGQSAAPIAEAPGLPALHPDRGVLRLRRASAQLHPAQAASPQTELAGAGRSIRAGGGRPAGAWGRAAFASNADARRAAGEPAGDDRRPAHGREACGGLVDLLHLRRLLRRLCRQ